MRKYKFNLSKIEYDTLKQYGKDILIFADIKNEKDEYFILFDDYEEFSDNLLFDIMNVGMDNQDTVNDIGREMYAIHDRIYY